MKIIYLLTTLIATTLSALAAQPLELNAGGVDSGGGKSVVCRDAGNQILSAEILDLYEGRILDNRLPLRDDGSYNDQLQKLVTKVEKLGAYPGKISEYFGSQVSGLLRTATFLPEGTGLEPTDDSVNAIAPKGCKIEQLAVYATRLNRLLIDSEIWAKLDETNRAALFFHESIYRLLREQGEIDSFYTRQVVSYYLSVPEVQPIQSNLPAETYECRATGNSTYKPDVASFYIYKNTVGKGPHYFQLQTNMANGLQMFTKSSDFVYLDTEQLIQTDDLGELLGVKPLSKQVSFTAYATSIRIGADGPVKMGRQATLQFKPGKKRMELSIGYSRPERPFDGSQTYPLTCSLKR